MYNAPITALSVLACIGLLLVAGVFAGGAAQSSVAIQVPVQAESVQEAALDAPADAPPPRRNHARVRASLSMPYFSFAQSLRPRG